jgi:hypothetical protein
MSNIGKIRAGLIEEFYTREIVQEIQACLEDSNAMVIYNGFSFNIETTVENAKNVITAFESKLQELLKNANRNEIINFIIDEESDRNLYYQIFDYVIDNPSLIYCKTLIPAMESTNNIIIYISL